LSAHSFAPLIATGSSRQFVNILRAGDGTLIHKIRHHDHGFLALRIGPVNCLTFHPNKLLLAAGGKDTHISIFTVSQQPQQLL
jgi:regulator-associated protein of mTOR